MLASDEPNITNEHKDTSAYHKPSSHALTYCISTHYHTVSMPEGSICWHHHLCQYCQHQQDSQHASARAPALHHYPDPCCHTTTSHNHQIKSSFVLHSTQTTAHKMCTISQHLLWQLLTDKVNMTAQLTYQLLGLFGTTMTPPDAYTTKRPHTPHYKPDLQLLWEPDWTRTGPSWPLPVHVCISQFLPIQNPSMSSSYYNFSRRFLQYSNQLACVVRPTTTPTTAAKTSAPTLTGLTIVWVFVAVPNGASLITL